MKIFDNLKLFYSSVFLQHFAYGVTIPTLIIWQHHAGLTFTEIGLLQSLGILAVLLAEIPSSFLADKTSRKLTMLVAFVFTTLSFYILTSAEVFIEFLIVQVFLSLGLAFFSGTQESFLHDLIGHKERMTKSLGRMSIVDEVATILGMGASSALIALLSIHASFYAGLFATILGFCTVFFLKEHPINQSNPDTRHHTSSFSLLNIALIAALVFFSGLALRGELLFQARFELNAIDLASLGLIYIFAKLFSILGSFIAYRVENKLTALPALMLVLAFQIVAFVLLIFTQNIIAIFALVAFFLSENIFRHIRDAWILAEAPQSLRATFLSVASFSGAGLALFVMPLLGFGIDQGIVYGIAVIVVVKIFCSVFLLFPRQKIFSSKLFQ